MMKECGIKIFEVAEANEKFVDAVNSLLVQLSSSPVLFTIDALEEIVKSQSSHLFFAEYEGKVGGMITVGGYIAPTGRKMWIEDVVVDEAVRGRSIGRLLVDYAVEYSKSFGDGVLMLTSRPSRVVANALYRSRGFQLKETNLYRMPLKSKE